ncbi:MAG: tRNA pseudouridine(55) synthase TruB [Oscillospiraceae bacterium]|jgi:tRNA pseudouridine55 synthase|nr:tRNA pseudouridine(55) synthase TruB [Oscillospiraceae bacterium]MCI1989807.1 tRNA pseudouridine(55) synthase TruB [Oscillospiraceae bacterium]MCI2035551.1 tRNA pseudouridine(55) synthase TruB [Oscillospiraceae bacterium]
MNGIIVMDKPAGFTSFDVVAVMRGVCRERKVGHTGTLDPMATGVLPLLLGTATRALSLLEDTGKEYEAGFRLGAATDTQDSTGKVIARSEKKAARSGVEAALPRFRGGILQTPPMYSAVSVNGRRLYDLARRGIEVERAKRPVTVSRLELTEFDEAAQSGRLSVACSKGTYVRTLCADLGEALGTYGFMTSLRRTRASGFSLSDAVTLEQAKKLGAEGILGRLLPVESLFSGLPALRVSTAQAVRFSNGGALELRRTALRSERPPEGARYRVCQPDGVFLGLGEVEGNDLRVLRLFLRPSLCKDKAAQKPEGIRK